LCHVVLLSQVITAEPWTFGSIAMAILLLGALVALAVWLVIRSGR